MWIAASSTSEASALMDLFTEVSALMELFPLLTTPNPSTVDHMILPHVNTLRVLLSGRNG